jgi:protocatechuate 3,4-dioxygenase beta subunit
MRLIGFIAAFSLLIPLGEPQASAQSPPASLEGMVTVLETGRPLAGAQVSLSRVFTLESTVPAYIAALPRFPSIPPTVTDSDGRFSFTNVIPGSFYISTTANGYVQANGQQRNITDASGVTSIDLSPGEVRKNLVIKFTKAGVVKGQLRSSAGQPLVDVQMQLWRPGYDARGWRIYQVVGIGTTNDRGEYRIFSVVPGRYYLSAGGTPLAIGGPINPKLNESLRFRAHYPGVADIAQAELITVAADSETTADLLVNRDQLYHIRGRVIDTTTGQPPPSIDISLQHAAFYTGSGSRDHALKYDPSTGVFDLSNVTPGNYWIGARFLRNPNFPPGTENVIERRLMLSAAPFTEVPVTVSGADVDGVTVTLTASSFLDGQLQVEGGPNGTDYGKIKIELTPSRNGFPADHSQRAGYQPQPTRNDGSFRVDSLHTGEYRVLVADLPAGLYVKSARLNGTDVLNEPLRFSGSNSGTLEVILGTKGGSVSGIVSAALSRPTSNAQVVLVPDTQRGRTDLYRTAVTDSDGCFAIRDIPPGNYKVFAWETMAGYGYFDQRTLQELEGKATSVRVDESSRVVVDVLVIAAEPVRKD